MEWKVKLCFLLDKYKVSSQNQLTIIAIQRGILDMFVQTTYLNFINSHAILDKHEALSQNQWTIKEE